MDLLHSRALHPMSKIMNEYILVSFGLMVCYASTSHPCKATVHSNKASDHSNRMIGNDELEKCVGMDRQFAIGWCRQRDHFQRWFMRIGNWWQSLKDCEHLMSQLSHLFGRSLEQWSENCCKNDKSSLSQWSCNTSALSSVVTRSCQKFSSSLLSTWQPNMRLKLNTHVYIRFQYQVKTVSDKNRPEFPSSLLSNWHPNLWLKL